MTGRMTRRAYSCTMATRAKTIRSYRDLEVWQVALKLIAEVYAVSARFPADEPFGLTAQIRRAAVSVGANIAEGHARESRPEYRHFVSIATGFNRRSRCGTLHCGNAWVRGHGQSRDCSRARSIISHEC